MQFKINEKGRILADTTTLEWLFGMRWDEFALLLIFHLHMPFFLSLSIYLSIFLFSFLSWLHFVSYHFLSIVLPHISTFFSSSVPFSLSLLACAYGNIFVYSNTASECNSLMVPTLLSSCNHFSSINDSLILKMNTISLPLSFIPS